ncbi:hypothetical protein DDZ14_11655 [Maritimibacter sp. 55A14]|nr:hypothetical protein DDZ14_11655 [Maritimibacter sp. 55A14]
MPEEVKLDWGRVRAALDADRADWSFWIDWYEDVLAERVRNWDLLEAIVQIPDEDWTKGPVHLNWIVAGLVEDHSRNADEIPVNAVRRGLKDNRASLEAQLCALYLMIDEEIERIRGMNPADEFETVQRERQLDFFRRLLAAVAGLRDALPQKGEPTLEEAQKVVGLLKTYLDLFRGWPRENANELVDSTCRVAIVGVCAGLGGLLGAPVIGASIGATMFGGKKIVDAFAQVFKANNP